MCIPRGRLEEPGMHACMHVCMYVYVPACTASVSFYVRTHVCINGCMYAGAQVGMHLCVMYLVLHVRMYQHEHC